MRLLVTGGAGFIGSNLIRHFLASGNHHVMNIDKLALPNSHHTIQDFEGNRDYSFHLLDICNYGQLLDVFMGYMPDAVLHLAAESHVDRSIDSPAGFIQSNIVGTFNLLECSRHYIQAHELKHNKFRFLHISTDEVFGSLDMKSPAFSESDPYRPNSPYSASKASSDHLVRAWQKTFGVPAIITNCSNNYGPFQYPEKLIPLLISKALAGEAMPIYGIGDNIRDWLYVNDHIKALERVLYKGVIGECYNIGGDHEISNLDLALSLCRIMDHKRPDGAPHEGLITFVADRPGHDFRYAMETRKIQTQLSWRPEMDFDMGLNATIEWYMDNQDWVKKVSEDNCYSGRLGLLE